MNRKFTAGPAVVGTMKWCGRTYDIIRFGSRHRIVNRETDRSEDVRGYRDFKDIRKNYPDAVVSPS
jgi:hypothetical protein